MTIVRPTHRGLIERLGKYYKFANPGFHWIIPFIDKIYIVNTTEQMVDAQPQEIITNDNLNASVDAQVYFRVIETEESVNLSMNAELIELVNQFPVDTQDVRMEMAEFVNLEDSVSVHDMPTTESIIQQ